MQAFDRQLDRASRVRVGGASVSGLPACPSAGGSAPQADPAPPFPLAHDTGSASFGCTCGHSRHAHRGFGRCEEPGCICWAYRRPNQYQNKNSARTGCHRSGA